MKQNIDLYSSIANALFEKLNCKHRLNCSLLGGDFGCVVFLYYASKIGLCNISRVDNLLDKVIWNLNVSNDKFTYCNGISGFCIGLLQLEKDGFIDGSLDSIKIFKNAIMDKVRTTIDTNLDILHGAIGTILPLLYLAKDDSEIKEFLTDIINNLYFRCLKKDINKKYWLYKNSKGLLVENLSMSHGIVSTLMFLSRCLSVVEKSEIKDKILNLLKSGGNYLVDKLEDPSQLGCYTPIGKHKIKSRLGWCYGDLGTSIAFRALGDRLGDSIFKDKAVEIALYAAINRRDLQSNYIKDACICHGASGVMSIFRNYYSHYGIIEFHEAAEYWRNITLSLVDNYVGYKEFGYYNYDLSKRFQNDSILEGNAGVCLCLMECQNVLNNILLLDYEI